MRYQIHLIDTRTNMLEAWDWVDATDRADAIAQRPKDWPISRTRATSRGPFA